MPTLLLASLALSGVLAVEPEPAPRPAPPVPSPAPDPVATPAAAEPSIDLTPGPSWTLQVEPSVWYAAPSGELKLPVSSGSGPGGFSTAGDDVTLGDLNLDSPRLSPAGEVHLSAGRLRFTFSGAAYSTDRDATTADSSFRLGSVAVDAGDRLDIEFDLTTVELTGGYLIWHKDFAGETERPSDAVAADLRLYAIGGARVYDFSTEVRSLETGRSAGADEFFGEGILGFRAEAELAERFTIDVQSTVGFYSDSDKGVLSVDVAAGFMWRPIANVGVQIGYRQLAYWLSDGEDAEEFEYEGRLAGLFAGVTLRF